MTTRTASHFNQVFSKLKKFGFLLESDSKLPSVCSIVTGAPLKGSWWSHPLAQTIFQVNEKLDDHPDVLLAKLVSGKVTFVHRQMWSEVASIGRAQEPWQTESLSTDARALLKLIESNDWLRTDQIASHKVGLKLTGKPGDTARELERKLLVHADQFHTETGAHAKMLETWNHWSKRVGYNAADISSADAKQEIEERLGKLNEQFGGTGRLPWW